MFGKTIRLFLIEGEASGRWKCELSNWTGLAFKIPRVLLSKCSDRSEMSNIGVYFLIGKSDDETQDKVYIGESEDVLYRLNQHIANGDKEWQDWNDCVVFVSKDNQLNKAMIKYLESSLYSLAVDADRCVLVNGNKPKKSSLSELDAAEMDEYLSNLRLVMGTLGYKFLEPPVSSGIKETSKLFFLKKKNSDYDAKAIMVDEGIVVLKGSKISGGVANSFKEKSYRALRDRLVSDGIIVDGRFAKDYLFSSYSAASSVIEGHNSNGWIDWKDENGKSIHDLSTPIDP